MKAPLLLALLAAIAVPAAAQTDRAALVAALRTLAAEGNAEAAYHLGMMRLLGLGGIKDEAAALALFRQAADAGDPLGAYKLGDFYLKGAGSLVPKDVIEARRLKTIAAEAGYAAAQREVARLHFEAGEMDAALEWLLRAARQGDAESLRALASLHNSDAMPKDGARTYAYYRLFLDRLASPTDAQKLFLTEFSSRLSDEDRARGEQIRADWTIEQSDLTKKALSGLQAAEALAKAQQGK